MPFEAQFGGAPPSPFQGGVADGQPQSDNKPKFVRVQSRRTQEGLPAMQAPPEHPQPQTKHREMPPMPDPRVQMPAPPPAPPRRTQEGLQALQAPGPGPATPARSAPPPMPPRRTHEGIPAVNLPPSAPVNPPANPPNPTNSAGPVQDQTPFPAPTSTPVASHSPVAPPPEPEISQFQWTSTNTSSSPDINARIKPQEELPPPVPPSLSSASQPAEGRSGQFPLYSSTDWHRPDAAMQLIEEERNDAAPPQPPTEPHPVVSRKPEEPMQPVRPVDSSMASPLPKVKSFGQAGHKPPSTGRPEGDREEVTRAQFTRIGADSDSSTAPGHQEISNRENQSRTLDPRLIAKETSEGTPDPGATPTAAAPEHQPVLEKAESPAVPPVPAASQIPAAPPPIPAYTQPPQQHSPQDEAPAPPQRIYDVEGQELSEPRELTRPSMPPAPPTPPQEASVPETTAEPEQEQVDQDESLPETGKDLDVSQAAAHIRTAESALSNDNFNVAVPLLNKALLIITESGARDSIEALSCHQKLGECCYQKGDYDEACEHYRECNRIIEAIEEVSPETIVLIQQKLAKALEKGQRFSEAKDASEDSINLANELLDPGHPLVPVAYRMHLGLLQKTNAPLGEIENFEARMKEAENAPAGRVDISDEIASHVNYLTGSFNLDNIEKQRQMRQARRKIASNRDFGESRRGRMALKPIGMALALIATIGIAGGGYVLYQTNQKKAESETKAPEPIFEKPVITKRMKPFLEQTFTSADGMKSIKIREDGIVEYKIGNKTRSLSWREGAPATDFISQIKETFNNSKSYSFKRTAQGFVDEDGTVLYESEAPDLVIVKEMSRLADLAKYYYTSWGSKYPAKRDNFSRMGPNINLDNPLGSGMKPLVRLRQFNKEEGQIVLEQTLEEFAAGKALFPPDGKLKEHPGLIECMSLRPFDQEDDMAEGTSFLIRAYGKDGKFISGSRGEVAFVLAQENGVEVKPVKEEDFKLPFEKGKSIVAHFVFK